MTLITPPFWKTTPLDQMTAEQWESLCDRCGRCCLQKLENRKTGRVYFTSVSCYLLDTTTCRCSDYAHRFQLVPSCIQLRPDNIGKIKWLPKTCAYRVLARGGRLESWHPLISGDPLSVHRAGISIQNMAISEERVHPDHLEDYIIENQNIY